MEARIDEIGNCIYCLSTYVPDVLPPAGVLPAAVPEQSSSPMGN